MSQETNTNVERRHISPNRHILWAKLNVTQQAAVSSLYSYGYELSFIRTIRGNTLVIMLLNNKPVTIDEDGEIDTQPLVSIRS